LGEALLAFLPDDAKRLLKGPTLRSMTGETVTDPVLLAAQLDQVATRGIALESDEAVLGECGAAAAVFDETGLAVGAVGMVVPSNEWPVDDGVVDAVQSTARTISRELGASRWPASPVD
jgi:DNA-binding IclR family transcriptional regulator